MRYQLRLPKGLHPEELADQLALTAWEGVIPATGPEGPDPDAYPLVARAVREVVHARLRPLDACGMMHVCTDGTRAALGGGPDPDRDTAIWGMELAEGADGLVRELARAAGDAARLSEFAQGGLRARLGRDLQKVLYRNELCGRPQCERIAEPVLVPAARRRVHTGGLAP